MSEDTKLDLAPIKARCAAATREPWKASCAPGAASVRSEWANCAIYINVRQNGETPECVTRWHRDAEFTAHARSDVPALVAEVERLREIKCDKVDCDRVEKDRREALARMETTEAEVARLRSDLAECYRITGADPDGDDDAIARKAVNAVRRLREESDHQGTRADEFAEEVKTMAGERDAAHAAIELIKTDRRFAQENADWYRVRLGIVMRENDTFAETVKKLRDDLAEAAGVNAANLNTLRSVRERVAELEIGVREIAIMHQDDRPGIGEPSGDFDWRLRSEAQERVARALLAKGGAA